MAGEERRVSTTPACSAVAAVTLTLAQVPSDLARLLRPSPQQRSGLALRVWPALYILFWWACFWGNAV